MDIAAVANCFGWQLRNCCCMRTRYDLAFKLRDGLCRIIIGHQHQFSMSPTLTSRTLSQRQYASYENFDCSMTSYFHSKSSRQKNLKEGSSSEDMATSSMKTPYFSNCRDHFGIKRNSNQPCLAYYRPGILPVVRIVFPGNKSHRPRLHACSND